MRISWVLFARSVVSNGCCLWFRRSFYSTKVRRDQQRPDSSTGPVSEDSQSRRMKSKPVPATHLESDEDDSGVRKTPAIELHHVRDVYDRVATQWAGTRYKAWPEVENFLRSHARINDLVGEIGCGNGKNLCEAASVTGSPIVIANDVSLPLCEIAALQTPKADIQVADIISVPMRSEIFDIVLCIAVLHHMSTPKRRNTAVRECCRLLRPGGKALFFAWAQEQDDGVSGHEFAKQDVFVPFHQKMYMSGWDKAFMPKHVDENVGHGVVDESKRSVVFQRYCHVFIKGELDAIITNIPGMKILSSFRDAGNWAIICEKEQMAPASSSETASSGLIFS